MSKVMHPEFAHRMQLACDQNPNVPPLNYGRLTWFTRQFEERFGVEVTVETIRKWAAGESKPRTKAMAQLAEILGVDDAWLTLGKSQSLTEKQRKVRNATADGAVNVVTGFIQMCGGHPSFPEKDGPIDIQAIIKGALYNFHVCVGEKVNGGYHFSVPAEATETLVVGVIRTGDLSVKLIELDWEGIEAHAKRLGGSLEVILDAKSEDRWWKDIDTFAERL